MKFLCNFWVFGKIFGKIFGISLEFNYCWKLIIFGFFWVYDFWKFLGFLKFYVLILFGEFFYGIFFYECG